jgi:DNA-binding transcriptional LysR family regulator
MFEQVKAMAVFAVVVEEGSFRQTAVRLSLSPSVVSQYISQLEQYLGAPLFYRSTRKLSLTSFGERFYPSCQQMVYWAETGLSQFQSEYGEISGKLHITVPAVLVDTDFPSLLADFCTTYPHIDLTMHMDNQRHHMIEEGIDLAIRIGWLEDSNLRAKKIMNVERGIFATPRFLAQHPPILAPADLERHPWVKTELVHSSIELSHRATGIHEKFHVKEGLTIKGASIFKKIILTDYGLAMGPKFLVKAEMEQNMLVEVLPDWRLSDAGMYFVWVDNTVKNPLINYFMDFIQPKLLQQLQT